MTIENWRARRDFIEADPEHQELSAAHRKLCQQGQDYEKDVRSGLYAIQRLLLARDCVGAYAEKLSCTSPQQDEELEELTATHGEGWGSMYRQAMDDISESVLILCENLANKRAQRETLQLEREASWQLVSACADKLGEAYDAQQSAKVDT